MPKCDQDIFNPLDLDKEEFNIDMYMIEITQNYTLPTMLNKNDILDKEIKEISCGIQNTVNENYTIFLSASQIVSNITRNLGMMERDMEILHSIMYEMDSNSSHILNKLQPSKRGITKWSKTQEGVHKLISLIDLVPNLKKLVEGGDYGAAAHHYAKAQSVLRQNRHLKSLKGIIEDSDEIVKIIKTNLNEKLDSSKYESGSIFEAMKLLLQLGEEPKIILKNLLLVASVNARKIFETIQIFPDPSQTNTEFLLVLSDLNSKYFDALNKAIDIAQRVFVKTNMNIFPVLENFVIEHAEPLHYKMRRIFKNNFNDIEDNFCANVLDELFRKCHDCFIQIPKIKLEARSVDFLLYICIDRSNFKLRNMVENFDSHLSSLEEDLNKNNLSLNVYLESLNSKVEDISISSLSSLCAYINPEYKYCRNASFRKQFCKAISYEGVFISFLRHLNNAILRKYSILKNIKHPCLCILFSKFTLELGAEQVPELLSSVKEKLYSSEENLKITTIPDISNECRATAEKMLQTYITVRQSKIYKMIKNSIANKDWMNMKEPWKVSAVIHRVLEEFEEAFREIESLFGTFSKKRMNSRDGSFDMTASLNALSRTSSPDSNSLDNILTNRIYRLFSRSAVSMDTVDFSNDSIFRCIVNLTLKSILEYVRHRTFNRYGLQQVQVDIFCLEVWVLRHLECNGQDCISLFDDIICSCYNRTIEPEFLNHQIVCAICQVP
ncbi:hypothetical protein JTE90_000175 [Oedothorax gibbosus]|uniref:Vacuolar protein sorting-associated protein 51 homolog n=1 Tax=Oedothorax gibbosus TaxID=931172 RepID=A0AAV6UU26_9ARAC|nr:hypothetical protein JTE90_000175 [Oedothorax gibbosus]